MKILGFNKSSIILPTPMLEGYDPIHPTTHPGVWKWVDKQQDKYDFVVEQNGEVYLVSIWDKKGVHFNGYISHMGKIKVAKYVGDMNTKYDFIPKNEIMLDDHEIVNIDGELSFIRKTTDGSEPLIDNRVFSVDFTEKVISTIIINYGGFICTNAKLIEEEVS